MKNPRCEDDEVQFDLSTARRNPYAERANAAPTWIVIAPDLRQIFPTSEAVDEALRLVVKAGALTHKVEEQGTETA